MRLRAAEIFGDGMILQRGKPVSVWGTAEPGSTVTAEIQGRTARSVADKEPEVWLASIGDSGMRWDIHPKRKRPVGERLGLLALGHIYGKDMVCDAPRAVSLQREKAEAVLYFSNVKQLVVRGVEVRALSVFTGETEMERKEYTAEVEGDRLRIRFRREPDRLRISFAGTPWYEVNLYNESGIPVLPFELWEKL